MIDVLYLQHRDHSTVLFAVEVEVVDGWPVLVPDALDWPTLLGLGVDERDFDDAVVRDIEQNWRDRRIHSLSVVPL